MFNQKGFSKIVVIIVALVLSVGSYFIFNKKEKNVPAQSAENESSQKLNENILKNGQYVSVDGSEPPLLLIDGVDYVIKNDMEDRGHSSKRIGGIAIGDLNNDGQDDAVITIIGLYDFSDEGGSSGGDIYLHAVTLDQNKSHEMILSIGEWLGFPGFITINSLIIKSGIISVEINDNSQSPSVKTIKKYKFDKNKLVPVL